ARVLEGPTRSRWIAWALLAAASLWTHYFAAFLVTAEICVLWWRLPRMRLGVAVWSAIAVVLSAPVLSVLAAQTDSRTDHIGKLSLTSRVTNAARQFAMGPNVPRAALEGAGLALAAGGLAVGLVIAARRLRDGRVLLVLAAVSLGLPLVLAVTRIGDRFLVRNVLIAWV